MLKAVQTQKLENSGQIVVQENIIRNTYPFKFDFVLIALLCADSQRQYLKPAKATAGGLTQYEGIKPTGGWWMGEDPA